jgi:hypothetical protein
MINWLKLRLRNWLNSAQDIRLSKAGHQLIAAVDGGVEEDPVLRFKVYSAIGGKIVEFSRYDRRADRSEHTLYIINNDEDFGQRIAKIATLENLKT